MSKHIEAHLEDESGLIVPDIECPACLDIVMRVYDAAMELFEKWEIGRIYIDHQNTDSENEADELDLLVERFDVACRRAKEGRDG